MSKQFLFGTIYDTDNVDFSKLKEKLYKEKTSFEINKNTFIASIYDKESTMKVSYNSLKKNVVPIEIAKNKDLMYFTTPEIIDLMTFVPTTSVATKERLYHLIDNYLDWNVSIGNIQANNLKGLVKEDLCKINKKVASYKVMSMEEFFKNCEKALTCDEISAIDIASLVFSRYGIVGEKLSWITNLKYSDLNRENNTVRIGYGDRDIILPVDGRFFEWVDKCSECKELDGYAYEWSDKIIRKTTKFEETELNDTYIYNRVDKVFKKGNFPRVSFKLLEFSRKIDFLLDIRKERRLTGEDFRTITQLFKTSPSPSSTNTLIKSYEALTDDKVQPMQIRKEDVEKYIDNDPEKSAENIRRKIGY